MTETAKRKLILINPAALDELISLTDAIGIVDVAMREFSTGQVGAPQRAVMTVNPVTRLGLMPGTMPGLGRFGLKVVSLSSEAPKFGLSSHQGMMLLFDDATGQPLPTKSGGFGGGTPSTAWITLPTDAAVRLRDRDRFARGLQDHPGAEPRVLERLKQ